jgi:hypothetical protein
MFSLSPCILLLSPVVIVLYIIIFIVAALFTLISALILSSLLLSVLSGWSRLAKHYSSQVEFKGRKWRHQSGYMGLIIYRRALTIGSDSAGFFLATPNFLRMGHPPLFIPWDEITVAEREVYRYFDIRFAFPRVPGATLQITRKLSDQLIAERNVLHKERMKEPGIHDEYERRY